MLYGGTDLVTPENHLGFSFNDRGGDLYLFDSLADGGGLVDSVEYGIQLPDKTIGRLADGSWALTFPTFGQPNRHAPLGRPEHTENQRMVDHEKVSFPDDYIELYNPDSLPIDLGGLYLTDNPVEFAHQVESFPTSAELLKFKPLNFIDPGQFDGDLPVGACAFFIADGAASQTNGHLTFKLSPHQGQIALYGSDYQIIDQVLYGPQSTDISEGRTPLGSDSYLFNDIPTRGLENIGQVTATVGNDTWTTLFDFNKSWYYNQTQNLDGQPWMNQVYSTETTWPQGPGLLYDEDNVPTNLRGTALTVATGRYTFYFRTHFTYTGMPDANTHLYISFYVDDGAVLYLNGHELTRAHFSSHPAPEPIYYTTTATNHEFALETRLEIPMTYLQNGDNVFAVEVHQSDTNSSDVVWGGKLEAKQVGTTEVVLREVQIPTDIAAIADNLRITEVMYQPAGNAAAEYIKLQNVGSTPLQLQGVRLNGGVDFIFPAMTLEPGESTVVVRDTAAFTASYGSGINIAGQYVGSLSNSGKEITLDIPHPYGNSILRFSYNPSWYPTASGSGQALGIRDIHAQAATWDKAASWNAVTPNWGKDVVSRKIFYNNSKFDALSDDNAIATNKIALLPGTTATFANYTNYDKGINGIIIDIATLTNPTALSAADFSFKIGNNNDVSAWITAPAPISVTVRENAGGNGSDRVVITWADGVIKNTWLKVEILADANTGLSSPDVFYFGNAIGESGNNTGNAVVDAQDESLALANKSGFSSAAITNAYDYNRDGRVTVADVLVARHNRTDGGGTPLQLISAPSGGPLAAQNTLQPVTLSFELVSAPPASMPAANLDLAMDSLAFFPNSSPPPQSLHSLPMWMPTLENSFRDMALRSKDAAHSATSSAKDYLRDAAFSRAFARYSHVDHNLSDDSTSPNSIETLLQGRLTNKAGKTHANAFDAIFAKLHGEKE